ncbi:MAG: hypothetical protein IKJ01_05515 [Lachnospiraceae bacterium]|nr:hypothetical protein [Lachnospiraceae bacterium]
MLPFLIIFTVFIITLSLQLKKNTSDQQQVHEEFWKKERLANNTRKQDISKLDYVHIPWEELPQNLDTPSEQAFWNLKEKQILNLTGLSNTDLKLQYGVANLTQLTEYDTNFIEMVSLLPTYAKELIDAGYIENGKILLEFGISCKADSKRIYIMLADIYKEAGETSKIAELKEQAKLLPELQKQIIIKELDTYLNESRES